MTWGTAVSGNQHLVAKSKLSTKAYQSYGSWRSQDLSRMEACVCPKLMLTVHKRMGKMLQKMTIIRWGHMLKVHENPPSCGYWGWIYHILKGMQIESDRFSCVE